MATSEVDDIFECSVCMEPILDKQPRLLVCAHTFCSPCLQQLAAQDQVVCPKCRTVTDLPSRDVENLPRNIELSNIKEFVIKLTHTLSENFKTDNLCKICLTEKIQKRATHICINCCNKPICQDCADDHASLEALKSHKIIEVEQTHAVTQSYSTKEFTCDKHKQKVEYFCKTCVEALCVYCAFGQSHRDHGSEVVDFKSGFQDYKLQCDDNKSRLGNIKSKIGLFKNMAHSDLEVFLESRSRLESKCQFFKLCLKECEDLLQNMDTSEKKIKTACSSFEDFYQKCEDAYNKWITVLQKSEIDYFKETKLMNSDIVDIFDEADTVTAIKYKFGNIMTSYVSFNMEDGEFNQEKFVHLERPLMVAEIKPDTDFELKSPWDLIAVDEDSIFVVDTQLSVLQKIATNREVLQKLQLGDTKLGNIRQATLFDEQLYIVCCRDIIHQYDLSSSGCKKVTEYIVDGISEMIAIAGTGKSILITEENCVSEYNLITRKREIKVYNLSDPVYTCFGNIHGEIRYIIASEDENKVFIYNNQWILQHTITQLGEKGDNLNSPCLVRVTPGGKLLIMEYHKKRISMFNMNGKFICVLLKLEAQIEGMAYTSPNLWIAHEKPHPCLRIYQVGDL